MKMVILMMPQVPRQEKDDFYDALAVALCHGQHQTALTMIRVAVMIGRFNGQAYCC